MRQQKIIETLGQYLNKGDMEIVKEYLDAKEAYLNHQSPDAYTDMRSAFQNAYFVIKQPMVCGEISRQQFDDFIYLVQEGVD